MDAELSLLADPGSRAFLALMRLAGLALVTVAVGLLVKKLRESGAPAGIGALPWSTILGAAAIAGAIGGGFLWAPTQTAYDAELEEGALTIAYGWPGGSARIATSEVVGVLFEQCGIEGHAFVSRSSLELDLGGRTIPPIEGPRDEIVRLAEAVAERRSLTPRWEDRTAELARHACLDEPESPW